MRGLTAPQGTSARGVSQQKGRPQGTAYGLAGLCLQGLEGAVAATVAQTRSHCGGPSPCPAECSFAERLPDAVSWSSREETLWAEGGPQVQWPVSSWEQARGFETARVGAEPETA